QVVRPAARTAVRVEKDEDLGSTIAGHVAGAHVEPLDTDLVVHQRLVRVDAVPAAGVPRANELPDRYPTPLPDRSVTAPSQALPFPRHDELPRVLLDVVGADEIRISRDRAG